MVIHYNYIGIIPELCVHSSVRAYKHTYMCIVFVCIRRIIKVQSLQSQWGQDLHILQVCYKALAQH